LAIALERRRIRLKGFSFLKGVFSLPRDLQLIFLASFLWDCGGGLYYSILPVYIRDLGGTILEVGVFYVLMNAIYFSTMIFGGFIADRYDRRKLAILYWIHTASAPLIYSFATNWQHLIPGAILYNVALLSPAIDVYIAAAAPKERVARAFAFTQAGYSLGMLFSPLLGAYLLAMIDMRWLLRIAFGFYLISAVTISFISPQLPEKAQKWSVASDFAAIVRNRKLMSWILLCIPITFVSAMSMPLLSPLLEDVYHLERPVILVLTSVLSAGQLALAAFLGWFGDRHGITWALIGGFGLTVIGMIVLGLPVLSLLLPLAVFLIGARQVTYWLSSSVVTKYSLASLRGAIFGLYMFMIGIGEIAGPYAGSILYEVAPTQPFLWTSLSLVILSFLVVAWSVLISKEKQAS